ncbi:MAG TPA: ABC transporter permease [Acidobacteriaceae bacterium]
MGLPRWLAGIVRGGGGDDSLAEELRTHVVLRADDLERGGLARAEAVRRARLEFGGFETWREASHRELRWSALGTLGRDLRFGLRMLGKAPGFTVVAVLTLALGIGANTALFTLVRDILLRPLPVRAAHRLMVVWNNNRSENWSRIGPSGQDYLDWREQNHSFEDLFLFEHGSGTLTGEGDPEQVSGLRVTTNFGDFLGVQPLLGRNFRLDEASARHNLMLLGYRYWQQKYNEDRSVIGRAVTLNGERYTIIGVLPASLEQLFPVDVVVPFDNDKLRASDSDLGVFGRLRPGVTVREADVEMNALMQRIARVRPERKGFGAVVVPLETVWNQSIRRALLVLEAAAAFILLLACANIANLLLSRGIARRREVAVRMSLGAGRMQVLRQFLVESTLLALMGGGAGLALAALCVRLWMRYGPAVIPVPDAAYRVALPPVHLGMGEVAFTLTLCVAIGVACGLITPVQMLRDNVSDGLKEGGRGSISAPRGQRMRAVLVVVEAALALLLVVGASLMIRSFTSLLATSPGFRPQQLLTLRIKLAADAAGSPYRDRTRQGAAFKAFLEKVRDVPGVQSAALTEIVPLSQDDMDRNAFVIREHPAPPAELHLAADDRDVSAGYFATMGIPLLRGRDFRDADDAQHPQVVVIDETLARQYFGAEDPLGRHIQVPDTTRPPREVVGVVGAVHDSSLSEQPEPTIYFPYLQGPDQQMSLVVRTPLPAGAILPAIRKAIESVDPNQAIYAVRPMEEMVGEVTSAPRIAFAVLNVLAALALILAAIGIYGVTVYAVSQRTQEVGVRMAFGAPPRAILSLMMGKVTRLTLLGAGAGLVVALALTRLMGSLLYRVSGTDPAIFAAAAGLVLAVATVACWIPARRAMRVDPVVALRQE